jgi:hypothetical protein
MTRSRLWTAGTAAVVVVVLLVGWLLVIGPKRSDAAELRDQAASQADQNKATAAQIKQLEADQEKLPAQNARIAAIKEQIPESPELPQLIRMLSAAGNGHSVSVEGISPGEITELTGVDGVSYIPLDVVAHGRFSELKAFLADLEPSDPQLKDRAFLVSGFTLREFEEQEEEGTVTDPDLLTLELQARVFMGAEPTAAATPGATATPGASTPAPSGTSSSSTAN